LPKTSKDGLLHAIHGDACFLYAILFYSVCRWAAVADADWPAAEAQRGVVMADFDGDYGDRRQVCPVWTREGCAVVAACISSTI
jgi:hypothetical protein